MQSMNMQIDPASNRSCQLSDPLGQLTGVNAAQWYRDFKPRY